MLETFKGIEGYENLYEVSSCGRIRSLKRSIIMKQYFDKYGYKRISLSKEGEKKSWFIHRLVAMTFIKNPKNLPEVNHKNSRRDDNNVPNLEWTTHSQNIIHSYMHGNASQLGENNTNAKCTNNIAEQVKVLKSLGFSSHDIAKLIGMSYKIVYRIYSDRSWKHISIS